MITEKSYKCPHCYQWSVASEWDKNTQKDCDSETISIIKEDEGCWYCCPLCDRYSWMKEIKEEKIEPIGYCPWCDEALIEDPVCPNCGDTSGLKPHWYELGNIYPMEKCIVDLYNELREFQKLSTVAMAIDLGEIFNKHKDTIEKAIKDCNK